MAFNDNCWDNAEDYRKYGGSNLKVRLEKEKMLVTKYLVGGVAGGVGVCLGLAGAGDQKCCRFT